VTEAAFFDLDKTVIAKASMAAFGRPLYDGGLIKRRTVLRMVYAHLVYLHLGASEQRLENIRDMALRLTTGWERARVCEIVEEALTEIVEPIVYREAIDLIEEHRAMGRRIVMVSASPEELAIPLGRHLAADDVIASRANVDGEGRYTGEMAFYAFGPFKAEAMEALAESEGIDLAGSYAYSDSCSDVPMLETVGHPVAVNPDRVLARLARERQWEIREFVRPVRLRRRVAPSRPAVALTAGATAAGAVAVAVGWWLGGRRARVRAA
jgi:HAD superfamily hydrolase (TIGR01490 family)